MFMTISFPLGQNRYNLKKIIQLLTYINVYCRPKLSTNCYIKRNIQYIWSIWKKHATCMMVTLFLWCKMFNSLLGIILMNSGTISNVAPETTDIKISTMLGSNVRGEAWKMMSSDVTLNSFLTDKNITRTLLYINPRPAELFQFYFSFRAGIANAISSSKWQKLFFENIHLINWVIWLAGHLPQTILSISVTCYMVWKLLEGVNINGRSKTRVNPFKPEFTIVILIHYKPTIPVAILGLQLMKMTLSGWKITENCHVLVNQFHGIFILKRLVVNFRDVKWCFNAYWGFKG